MTTVWLCLMIGGLYAAVYAVVLWKFFPDTYLVRLLDERITPWLKNHI